MYIYIGVVRVVAERHFSLQKNQPEESLKSGVDPASPPAFSNHYTTFYLGLRAPFGYCTVYHDYESTQNCFIRHNGGIPYATGLSLQQLVIPKNLY